MSLRVALLVGLLVPAPALLPSAQLARHGSSPSAQLARRGASPRPAVRRRAASPQMLGGPGGGGFFNLGGPEVVVIGAVAWVLLGPKELFKLSREAGKFIGEWQQLGQQARDQFQSALETELDEEAAAAGGTGGGSAWAGKSPPEMPSWNAPAETPSAAEERAETFAARQAEGAYDDLPPLSEYAAMNTGAAITDETPPGYAELSEERREELRAELEETLGTPEGNRATFAEQMSGETNRKVMEEYPAELAAPAAAVAATGAEEDLIETRIAMAENDLATLRAESEVLRLRRKQQEAALARAQQAEFDAVEAQDAAGAAPADDMNVRITKPTESAEA